MHFAVVTMEGLLSVFCIMSDSWVRQGEWLDSMVVVIYFQDLISCAWAASGKAVICCCYSLMPLSGSLQHCSFILL